MDTKHLLALVLLTLAGSITLVSAMLSQRVRDAALFLLIVGSVLIERMSATFMGVFWYRGTSRGIEISAVDIIPLCLLIATVIVPRYPRGRFYWPASLGMLLVYFVYCFVSVWNAEPHIYGVWELSKMFRGILVFLAAALFVRTPRELAVVVAALSTVAYMECLNAIEQKLFKAAWRTPGTLDHENTLSTYLCTIAPVLIAGAMSNWSKWLRWYAGVAWVFAAGAEVLTLSRLGIPVFAVVSVGTAVTCSSWKPTKEKFAIVTAASIGIAAFLMFSWDELKARYAMSNLQLELRDERAFETRGVYWRIAKMMRDDHPYGVGLNNWSYYVGKTYGPALGYHYEDYDELKSEPSREEAPDIMFPPAADSLPALTLGELGMVGLVLLLLLWARWLQMGMVFLGKRLNPEPIHRMAIGCMFGGLGILLQSSTEWTYRQTPVMFTFHVLMGCLASCYYKRRQDIKAAKRARRDAEDEDDIREITVVRDVPNSRPEDLDPENATLFIVEDPRDKDGEKKPVESK